MTRFDRFAAEGDTYESYGDFSWAIWKERETLAEAVASLEARVGELEAAIREHCEAVKGAYSTEGDRRLWSILNSTAERGDDQP